MNKAAQKHIKLCAVALYIALACTCVFSSVLSYYSVTRSATADARIAIFALQGKHTSGGDFNFTISNRSSPSQSRTYRVQNYDNSGTSEVNMTFRVDVQVGNQLPRGTSFTVNDIPHSSAVLNYQDIPGGRVYTYSFFHSSFQLAGGKQSYKDITLTFTVNNSKNDAVSLNADGVDIRVNVVAQQSS